MHATFLTPLDIHKYFRGEYINMQNDTGFMPLYVHSMVYVVTTKYRDCSIDAIQIEIARQTGRQTDRHVQTLIHDVAVITEQMRWATMHKYEKMLKNMLKRKYASPLLKYIHWAESICGSCCIDLCHLPRKKPRVDCKCPVATSFPPFQ